MKITKTFDTKGKKLLGIGMTAALVLTMSATAFAMADSIQEWWSNPDLPERVVIVSGDEASTGESKIHLVTEDEYAAIERGEINLADGVAPHRLYRRKPCVSSLLKMKNILPLLLQRC